MFGQWPNEGTLFALVGVGLFREYWKWHTYETFVDQPVVAPNKNMRSTNKLRCKSSVSLPKLQQ